MELALCKELGEQAEVCASKKQLPSEEELRGYLKRVETLEQTLVGWSGLCCLNRKFVPGIIRSYQFICLTLGTASQATSGSDR